MEMNGNGFDDTCEIQTDNCFPQVCFGDPCPRYGARVRITYSTTRNDTGKPFPKRFYHSHSYDQLTERQTGENFRSRSEPDCRYVTGKYVLKSKTLSNQ